MKRILIKCGSYNHGSFWGVYTVERDEEIEWVKEIGKTIKEYPDLWNWTNHTKLVKVDGEWKPEKRVYGFYPTLDRKLVDWFSKIIPIETDHIEQIIIEEIKHEDRAL